jgi:hypothetical protein
MSEKVLGVATYAAYRKEAAVYLIAKGEGECEGIGFEQRPERIMPPMFNFNFFKSERNDSKRFAVLELVVGVGANAKSLRIHDAKGEHTVSIYDRTPEVKDLMIGDGDVFPH